MTYFFQIYIGHSPLKLQPGNHCFKNLTLPLTSRVQMLAFLRGRRRTGDVAVFVTAATGPSQWPSFGSFRLTRTMVFCSDVLSLFYFRTHLFVGFCRTLDNTCDFKPIFTWRFIFFNIGCNFFSFSRPITVLFAFFFLSPTTLGHLPQSFH